MDYLNEDMLKKGLNSDMMANRDVQKRNTYCADRKETNLLILTMRLFRDYLIPIIFVSLFLSYWINGFL